MIKLFRKIRQKLIDDGNLKRYLIYAIGEIVLVMIGILLALQVNTWSQNNSKRVKEKIILSELLFNLNMNVNHFEDEIKRQEGIIQNIDVLIALIDNDEEFNDSLGMKYSSVSWTESITITQATFDLINESNIGLISSDTLRNRTVHLINGLYQKESKIINNVAMEQYTGIVMPIYLEYVRFDKKGIAHISDYERFKRDPKSINLLSTRRYWKNAVIDKLNSLRKETNLVSSMIELEMELW